MCGLPGEPAENLARLVAGTRFEAVRSTPSTGSTNADVAAQARLGHPEGFVLIADEQTAGRGRRDRTWASPASSSVSMSILLRPAGDQRDLSWLSLLAGMAVTRGLRSLADEPSRVSLKWPNDVLIDGDKVCGILSELVDTPSGYAVVVGIGINLSLDRADLPVAHATSLALAGLPHGRDDVVSRVLIAFDRLYADWLGSGPPLDDYATLCASIGAPLRVMLSERDDVEGTGAGITPDGRLIVATPSGTQAFAVGDVVHARLS